MGVNLTKEETRHKKILQSIFFVVAVEFVGDLFWIIYSWKYQISLVCRNKKCGKLSETGQGSQRHLISNFESNKNGQAMRVKHEAIDLVSIWFTEFTRCKLNTRYLHIYSYFRNLAIYRFVSAIYIYLFSLSLHLSHCSPLFPFTRLSTKEAGKKHPITAICFIPIPRHPFVRTHGNNHIASA